ncbi:MAG: ABC transporter permease [Saccharofermentanales bacterium]|jgi:peptide/nickel transport system permease protein|nr:ABC transporter permease [Clostridiaceae bacterium]
MNKKQNLKRLMKNNRLFAVGLVICLFWFLIAIISLVYTPQDPLFGDTGMKFSPPSSEHWFGTDELGRDVFSRVIAGSRTSIGAGLATIILAGIVGCFFGGISGYIGGIFDDILMRLSELVQSFPTIILAMVITSALGPNLFNTLLAMVVVWWPNYARVMRSMVIQVKTNEYIKASRSLGASNVRIFIKEILPNSIGAIIVLATVDFGNAILLFSGLSYLGLGSPPPTPEWGAMVSGGSAYLNHWWMATFPGIAILTMSLGANFIGDGVRDMLDPKLRKEI